MLLSWLFVVGRAESGHHRGKARHALQKPGCRPLQAMPQTAVVVPPISGLARHLFVQVVASAFRLLVLFCQFNHLFLQIHQPMIRLEVPRGRVHPWIFVPAPGHVP